MGLVSGNRLNRFWQKGVKPIKEAVAALQIAVEELSKASGTTPDAVGTLSSLKTTVKTNLVAAVNEVVTNVANKLDKSKVVASINVTEPGFAMDAKTASEEFAKLNSNSDGETITNDDITPITPLVGSNSGTPGSYYYKKGSRVSIHLALQISNGKQKVFIMPAGYRPYSSVYTVGMGADLTSSTNSAVGVSLDGSVIVSANGNGYMFAHVEYDAYN